MKRRTTFRILGGGVLAGLAGFGWLSPHPDHPKLALDLAMDRLDRLNPYEIETTGAWEVARTFDHLAQGVDFSLSGYPVMKPAAFRATAGSLAFAIFQARGQMSHGLDQPIPGEVIADAPRTPAEALANLRASLSRFAAFEGPLHPHFAYGALDKAEYAMAHVMHINNNLTEFRNA